MFTMYKCKFTPNNLNVVLTSVYLQLTSVHLQNTSVDLQNTSEY